MELPFGRFVTRLQCRRAALQLCPREQPSPEDHSGDLAGVGDVCIIAAADFDEAAASTAVVLVPRLAIAGTTYGLT